MAGIESEIRWGSTYDNVIAFTYPKGLDDVRTWRRPAPGSRRTRNAAGVTDSWVNKRDFLLAGRARWFAHQYWGGLGLQDFLDWAGAGNTFRFVPDTNYPHFYVGDCYLEEPFDDPAPTLEEADGSHAIDIVIRQQAYDFHLARRGLLFEYVPGKSITDPSSMAATFTRATTATYASRGYSTALAGSVTSAASGTLRDTHYHLNEITNLYERTTLLEKAGSNLCLQSENFGTTWSAIGTPTRSAAAVADTVMGVALDLIGDDTAGGTEGYEQTVTFTGNANKGISVFMKRGTSASATGNDVVLRDTSGGGADRLDANIVWSAAGVPTVTMSAGAHLGSVALGNGVYRLLFRASSVVAANTNNIQVYATRRGTSADQGNVYVGGVQCEDSTFPTSYKKTTTVTVTRNLDALQFPFSFVPQHMTLYLKFVEMGTKDTTDGMYFQISDTSNNAAKLYVLRNSSSDLEVAHTTSVSSAGTSGGITWSLYDTVEIRVVLAATGAVTLAYSVNGAAESTVGTSSTLDLAAAWSGTNIAFGSQPGGSGTAGAYSALVARVAAGTKTLAEMRAI